MKKIRVKNLFLALSLVANIGPSFALGDFADGDKIIQLEEINSKEFFTKNHLDTQYSPLKLETDFLNQKEIDLEDIIATALENNLSLKIAKQNSKSAKWTFWNKIADLLPDFSLRASKQNRDGTFFLNSNFQAPIDETISSAGMRLNYRALNGGASTFIALSQRYYRQQANLQEQAQYDLAVYNSVDLFLNLLKHQASMIAKLKSLKRAKENFDNAQKRLSAGTGTKFEVLQSEANMARAQQELVSQESAFRLAQIDLSEHLNIELDSSYKLSARTIEEIDLIDDSVNIDEFVNLAFENNPNIAAALSKRKAVTRESFATRSAFVPKVDLFLDYSGTGQQWSDLFPITTLGLDAQYNIGDGLGLSAVTSTLAAKANVETAELEYKQEKLSIEKALRRSYLSYQAAKSLVHASRKQHLAAKEALRLSKLRYENGLEIFANLTQREFELTDAQVNLINAISDYNLSQAKLVFNMGLIDPIKILALDS